MRRYGASLLVQESGFHQLVAEFNMGRGIARASLAQEVAITVADAMTSFSQVRTKETAKPLESCTIYASGYFAERTCCLTARGGLVCLSRCVFVPIIRSILLATSPTGALVRSFAVRYFAVHTY